MTIQAIKNHATYKAVLKDSFGGVMYNVANAEKYSPEGVKQVLTLWDRLTENQKGVAGGIMKGTINFLKEEF